MMSHKTGKPTFRGLVNCLADRIGRHQVPVVDGAHEIRDFLGCDGVHHELISGAVRRLYRANRCGWLDAPVERDVTLTTLATIRSELMQCSRTDIDQYRLAENLCMVAQGYFEELQPSSDSLVTQATRNRRRARIVTLPGVPAVIPSLG